MSLARRATKQLDVIALGILFGLSSLWWIWEQDLFWQIRSGSEILSDLALPTQDTWSYSVAGAEWRNVQWLFSVLIAPVFSLFGIPGLVVMRGLTAGLLLALMAVGIKRSATQRGFVARWPLLLATLVPAFVVMSPRIQLRSELFVLVVFAAVVALWSSSLPQRQKRWGALIAMVLCSNLHVGLTPFMGVLVGGYLLAQGDWRRRSTWGWLLLLAAASCFNPHPLYGLHFIVEHIFYFEGKLLDNPEHRRLATSMFSLAKTGYIYWTWLLLVVASLTMLLFPVAATDSEVEPESRRPKLVMAVLFFLLLALCFERTRAFPFLAIFAAPYFAQFVHRLSRPGPGMRAVVVIAALSLWGMFLDRNAARFGFGIEPARWPVASTAFIKRVKPQPNIYHTFSFGNYLLGYLPGYKVFGDTRETIFRQLEKDYIRAFRSAHALGALIDRFDVKTILTKIPGTERVAGLGHRDILQEYTPRRDWALVFFDDVSVVMLRRIPEHADIIRRYEYRLLRPNLPPIDLFMPDVAAAMANAELRGELARCRLAAPDSVFCSLANATMDRLGGDGFDVDKTIAHLERLARRHPRETSILVELSVLYGRSGDREKARQLEQRLGPSTTMPSPTR